MENSDRNFFQAPETAVGKGKRKVKLVPEQYFLPRYSIPKTIAWFSFLTAAGVGAGMLVEAWIKKKVENGTAILWREDADAGRDTKPSPSFAQILARAIDPKP